MIEGRKFDIRVWVFINYDFQAYIFKEGYIRTSTASFSLKHEDVDATEIHLTNNAIQKNDENYGKYEDGNQLSYDQATEKTGVNFKEKVVP